MVFVVKLLPDHEIIGLLRKINSDGQQIRLIFSFIRDIELPKDAFSQKELEKYLDKKVGIFNFEGKFFLRKIKGE